MKTVDIHAAKTHLSKLVDEASAGEEIIITKAGKPVARLMPIEKSSFAKGFGAMKGKIHVSDDFDDPLPPEILKSFTPTPSTEGS